MRIIVILFFFTLCFSCQKVGKGDFMSQQLEGVLEITGIHARKGIQLWSNHQHALSIKNLAAFNEVVKADSYYLVPLLNETLLSKIELHGDRPVLRFTSGSPGEFGIFKNPKEKSLQLIAASAHTLGDSGLPCGASIKLMPLLSTKSYEYFPPIYDENISLDIVATLIDLVAKDSFADLISFFEVMGTRYHNSTHQRTVSSMLIEKITEITRDISPEILSIDEVDHSGTHQKSLIVQIRGSSFPEEKVIFGAHLDSINSSHLSNDAPAPGADDDASGLATLLTMLKIINDTGATFERTLEFHAYAAEEVGLVGSGEIAADYSTKSIKVAAMMQFDMTAFSSELGKNTIFLINNNTDQLLRRSVKDLMNNYLGGDFEEKKLSAGRSDYYSWDYQAFPAVFPFEDPNAYNPKLHTEYDTSSQYNNLDLALRFIRLGLAFAVHYGGIVSAHEDYVEKRAVTDYIGDIKVAVKELDGQDSYDILAAAPKSIDHIEFCLADSDKNTCQNTGERFILDKIDETAERRFFAQEVSTEISIDSALRLLLFAYDEHDQLVQQRFLSLENQ